MEDKELPEITELQVTGGCMNSEPTQKELNYFNLVIRLFTALESYTLSTEITEGL